MSGRKPGFGSASRLIRCHLRTCYWRDAFWVVTTSKLAERRNGYRTLRPTRRTGKTFLASRYSRPRTLRPRLYAASRLLMRNLCGSMRALAPSHKLAAVECLKETADDLASSNHTRGDTTIVNLILENR
jgi:hypothetical protein